MKMETLLMLLGSAITGGFIGGGAEVVFFYKAPDRNRGLKGFLAGAVALCLLVVLYAAYQ
jgi:hypothetical protein